jgi:hypothetical protein
MGLQRRVCDIPFLLSTAISFMIDVRANQHR